MSERLLLVPERVVRRASFLLSRAGPEHHQPDRVVGELHRLLRQHEQQQLDDRAYQRFRHAYGHAYAAGARYAMDNGDRDALEQEAFREAYEAALYGAVVTVRPRPTAAPADDGQIRIEDFVSDDDMDEAF